MATSSSGDGAKVTATGFRTQAYYLPAALHERLKAAWFALQNDDGPDSSPTLSALVARLMLEEAQRLEERYNAGQPFPPAPKGARGQDPEAIRRQGDWLAEQWRGSRATPAAANPDETA